MVENSTEVKILDAARQVFLEKGFEGARMQEIADNADINKAMLHYYFRKKDKLFEKVFDEAFMKFIPQVGEIMLSDEDLIIKIKYFISTYIISERKRAIFHWIFSTKIKNGANALYQYMDTNGPNRLTMTDEGNGYNVNNYYYNQNGSLSHRINIKELLSSWYIK
jgi:AcrR family transcriptional regulator